MVGIIIHTAKGQAYYNMDKMMYHVQWFVDDPPVGRDGRWGTSGFFRKDLKFISKIKQ